MSSQNATVSGVSEPGKEVPAGDGLYVLSPIDHLVCMVLAVSASLSRQSRRAGTMKSHDYNM